MMNVIDIINKKRLGRSLSYDELSFFFNGYLNNEIKDYQMSSLLMAICIRGMSDEEIFALTKIFIESGDVLGFSDISGIKVDKHSTGGIGDKTTLVIGPIVASLGVPVVKMSGRGLGYTGGTIDKLESIPNFRVNLTTEEIIEQVKSIGLVITGQTADLAPMDKVIYALRDVTGTVSSIPLIASSIMSKKIAGGADKILIDIKVGKGALLKTKKDAYKLSQLVIKIGKFYNREVRTIISDMDIPLGHAVGNSLEVIEAMNILCGKETKSNLVELCIQLASEMVSMGKEISIEEATKLVKKSIKNRSAYNKFLEMIKMQGGNISDIKVNKNVKKIRSTKSGVIVDINALEVGKLAINLGTGRMRKEDDIDYGAGIYLEKLVGQRIRKGAVLMKIYSDINIDEKNIENIFTIK